MDRRKIIELLMQAELKLPVYDWKYGNLDIWPVCKEYLFFQLISSPSKINSPTGNNIYEKLNNKVKKNIAGIAYHFWTQKNIKHYDVLFVGSKSHRVDFNGKFINRYFEPLKTKDTTYLFIEYNGIENGKNYGDRYLDLTKYFTYYRVKNRFNKKYQPIYTPGFENLKEILKESVSVIDKLEKNLLSLCREVELYATGFENILRNAKSNVIYGLCYYSPIMYGLHYAANKLEIENYDIQHGGQGALHAMYTFCAFPLKGLNTLPQNFWVWDKSSEYHIKKWLPTDGFHNVFLKGNPWLNYAIQNNKEDLNEENEIILYTLQASELDRYIVDAIKLTPPGYKWWLRLHPRMRDKAFIQSQLESEHILDKVEIDKATNFSLPILLNACKVHISKYSGSIIEAEVLNKPSIILEEVGYNTFKEYIDTGNSIGLLSPTSEKLLNLILQFS